ncbi:PIG-L deacetylase family protein [Melittangium boletus]|uniref:LmbE-like protein n=1 Tax=Melittangium boletus DSM 14713 TaxID=1294270 RepID=A0A250IHT5_9BACT|nr:PIG-L family deacetylase [Melittangium boletus]ATB30793.1 LmbE-like protein [Melittangium boletus DSM 14713]
MWPPDENIQMEGLTPREGRTVAEVLGPLVPMQALRGSVLFVAAHPDDAVQGASWLLRQSPGCHVVHVTDGAPRDAAPRGLTREAYARQREVESFAALALAGLSADQLLSLGAVAGEAPQELVTLTECLMALIKALRPSLLVVPPYEGGHPDHDAAAFISHSAVALLVRAGRTAPSLLEMLSPAGGASAPAVATVALTDEERAAKQRMLACAHSREAPLSAWAQERYRRAPRYDFTRQPREGMTASPWRRLARQALEELKLIDTPWH